MTRESLGWIVAAALGGLWLGQLNVAHADGATTVECKAFYQDFPNGMVGPKKAVEKAQELGAKVGPWLAGQLSDNTARLALHSFIPFGTAGGAELVCVAHR